MGWWRSGNGQDIIGDGVADRVLRGLQQLARDASASGRPNLTFEAILGVAGDAIGDRPEALVSDPQEVPSRTRACRPAA